MRNLLLLLAVWLAVLPRVASAATTLAVLPLEKATGSEAYDGLGTALAGMLVSDLAGVPGLVLVERSRLDALLGEIELSESGFLDPATAQQLGKGLGAQVVITGSWSVVSDTFLLDARIVEVQSSQVLDAASANGPVTDFVAVEKQVVEGLVDHLDVTLSLGDRRRLLLQTPTESFPAFAAYGEGLARKDEGKLDDAAAAFERALSADPDFATARSELAAVKARVERMHAEDAAARVSDAERRLLAVIEGTVDERTRPPKYRDSLDDLARWALRLEALMELDRHCERMEEMRHFLVRRQGDVDMPPETSRPFVLVRVLSKHAWELGMVDKKYADEDYSHDMRVMNAASILGNPASFVLDLDRAEPDHYSSDGLYRSTRECVGISQAVEVVAQVQQDFRKWGVSTRIPDTRNDPTVTVDDQLEAFLLTMHVRLHGFDAEVEQRIGTLLDRFEDSPDRSWAKGIAGRLVKEGEAWEKHQAMRQGLPEDVILGMVRAVAARDPAMVRTETPICATAVEHASTELEGRAESYEEDLAGPRRQYAAWSLSRMALALAPLLDFGCLAGIPPRFQSEEQALSWLQDGRSRENPAMTETEDCVEGWEWFDKDEFTSSWDRNIDPSIRALVILSALRGWYGRLEADLCAYPSRVSATAPE